MAKVQRRKPNPDGTCPVLRVGEYCRESDGMHHFRTPDGFLFAVGGNRTHSPIRIQRRGESVSIINGHISHAGYQGVVVVNVWTVQDGEWVKI